METAGQTPHPDARRRAGRNTNEKKETHPLLLLWPSVLLVSDGNPEVLLTVWVDVKIIGPSGVVVEDCMGVKAVVREVFTGAVVGADVDVRDVFVFVVVAEVVGEVAEVVGEVAEVVGLVVDEVDAVVVADVVLYSCQSAIPIIPAQRPPSVSRYRGCPPVSNAIPRISESRYSLDMMDKVINECQDPPNERKQALAEVRKFKGDGGKRLKRLSIMSAELG